MIPGAARAVQKALLQRQKSLPQLVQHPGGDEQHHSLVVADGVLRDYAVYDEWWENHQAAALERDDFVVHIQAGKAV